LVATLHCDASHTSAGNKIRALTLLIAVHCPSPSQCTQELEERMDLVKRVRTVNENRIAVLEDERDAALTECAGRDK